MATVNQTGNVPTNKLAVATVAAAALSVAGLVVRNTWPQWYDAEVWASISPIVIFVAGWLVPDRPNISVTVEPQQ